MTQRGAQGVTIGTIGNSNSVAHYPGEGGVVISSSRKAEDDYLKSVCVAPPAQAAQSTAFKAIAEIAARADGKVTTPSGVATETALGLSASKGYEATAAISQLFAQNERTLLLQYSLYRLCEAYMNGMFAPYSSPVSELIQLQAQLKASGATAAAAADQIEKLINSTLAAMSRIEDLTTKQKTLRLQLSTAKGENKQTTERELETNQSQIRMLEQTYLKNTYREAFDSIMDTAVRLAQIEKERAVEEAKAAAERARAEAETAKVSDKVAAAEKKAKEAEESAKATRDQFEQLRKSIIDSSLTGLTCLTCSKKESTSSPDKKQ